MHLDASQNVVGAVLFQWDVGQEHQLWYVLSRNLKDMRRHWCRNRQYAIWACVARDESLSAFMHAPQDVHTLDRLITLYYDFDWSFCSHCTFPGGSRQSCRLWRAGGSGRLWSRGASSRLQSRGASGRLLTSDFR